jgi:hypothetical protein
MNGYRPDWVGALTSGAGIGLLLVIVTRLWPRPDQRKSVLLIAVAIGVALSIVARLVLRRFGL